MRRCHLRLAFALASALWLVAAPPLVAPAVAAGGGRPFHQDAMKVRGFEAPVGWEPQPVGSYTRLLAAWVSEDGGRMTLVAQKVAGSATARSLAELSRPLLERQGFRELKLSTPPAAADESDRVIVDASLDDGRRFVRQLYAVADGIGYVVTMVGPVAHGPEMRRDFDQAATSLSVGDTGSAAGDSSPPRR